MENQTHYMQTRLWANIKKQYGWKNYQVVVPELPAGSVTVYTRRVPGLGTVCYAPGLYGINEKNVTALTEAIKKTAPKSAFVFRLESNDRASNEVLSALQQAAWKKTAKHVQYRHTVQLDLTLPDNDLWMSLKSRGRYEILQAEKFGVVPEEVETTDENLEKMYELMQITSSRNAFFIRDKDFTMAYWKAFREAGQLRLFFASHEADTLAGAVVITNGIHAWYKDGGSVRLKSKLMAARLLQWDIVKTLKKQGFTQYDLGGIPEPDTHQDSSMKGIYVFKTAYSKDTISLLPTLELPLSKSYTLWPKAEKQWLRAYNFFAHNLWW